MYMKPGFVPALGTPLTAEGELCVNGFKTQIEQQIAAGAVGLLCMGSMGQEALLSCFPHQPSEITRQSFSCT